MIKHVLTEGCTEDGIILTEGRSIDRSHGTAGRCMLYGMHIDCC